MSCSPFSYSFKLKLVFLQITSLSIELRLNLKYSADQILTMKSDFVSFDHFQGAIRSFSNNLHVN